MDLLKLIQNKNFLYKFLFIAVATFAFLFSIYTLYSESFNQLVTKSLNSNFVYLFNSEKEVKFFSEAHNLFLYFRHEVNPENPQFSYISIDIRTHFYISLIVFVSLLVASPIHLSKKAYFIFIASGLIWGFFILKLYLSAESHLLSTFQFDKLGNIIGTIESKSETQSIIQILDKILNSYGSIGLRPMFTVILWILMMIFADKKRWIMSYFESKNASLKNSALKSKIKLQKV